MSKSTHQIAIKAVDQTGGAFKSIKSTAAATGASIKSMVGGAIAAAGAYLGFRAVKGGIEELGHLSDIAQKTSTNVAELTQAATAMNILGIQNMGVDQLAKSFDYLQKTTGRTGMSGFLETIGELGKIEDVAKRGQEAMKIFGRSGMEFMPLINAADKGIDALQGVINAMPSVPQAAADAGDEIADSMTIIANGVHSIWLQAIAGICKMFVGDFPGNVRVAAASAAAWMQYYANISGAVWESTIQRIKNLKYLKDAVGGSVGGFFSGLFSGKNPLKEAAAAWNYWMDFGDAKVEKIEEAFQKPAEALAVKLQEIAELKMNYEKAAVSTAKRIARDDIKLDIDGVSSISRNIRNDLALAGSNAALKMAIVGPTMQSEQKRTNNLLERVVKNTEKTVDGVRKVADAASGQEVID